MRLTDISIRTPYNSKIDFRESGTIWGITSLFLACLKVYDSNKIKKVIVEIDDESNKIDTKMMLDVILIEKIFDFKKFN
jgi:hypothetical protein